MPEASRPTSALSRSAKLPRIIQNRSRQQQICDYLGAESFDVGVILDFEGLRNHSLRYLSGQPEDALLFLFAKGESLLVPWDVPLARSLATADKLIPYETYGRSIFECIKAIFQERHIGRAELSGILSYPLVKAMKEALPGVKMEWRSRSPSRLLAMRCYG